MKRNQVLGRFMGVKVTQAFGKGPSNQLGSAAAATVRPSGFGMRRYGAVSGTTMKAAVVRKFKEPLGIENVAIPEPSPNQVLIRVKACGVCHTDLHAADGDWPVKPNLPLIPGHEGVGEVVEVGSAVKRLKKGDRVGVPWLYDACGSCPHCLTGWETLCHGQHNTGYSVNGGYAEYVVAPESYVGVLPEGMSYVEAAPLLCAGVTTYKGLKQTETKPGQWCVVFGVGGLGHIGLQYAKSMGMSTIAVDVADDKLQLAKQLGAEITINATKEDPGHVIQKEVGGAHGCLVTAVNPRAFKQAISTVRRGGTVSLVGLPPGDFPLPIFDIVLGGITVRGSIVGTRQDLQECLDIAARSKIKPVVEAKPLDAINETFSLMRQNKINGRIVLEL